MFAEFFPGLISIVLIGVVFMYAFVKDVRRIQWMRADTVARPTEFADPVGEAQSNQPSSLIVDAQTS